MSNHSIELVNKYMDWRDFGNDYLPYVHIVDDDGHVRKEIPQYYKQAFRILRRIENDATRYKQAMSQKGKGKNKHPRMLAGGENVVTQTMEKEAKGDYKSWRKKEIAKALKNKPKFIKTPYGK